ncbi:MAG: DNA (cytosine-5-)-methyltransferase [Acutalibacteraceae bacterium]|nr:DNA (cytosine-5-)-methyltransferase [Acutalibacteraceae bacterium]
MRFVGLDWELVNYCEIDRWASLSYSMVNQCDESLNLRDVRTVTAETVRGRQVDLITYGFPCQDISIAGKQQGFVNDSGGSTRSGLFFEALRIIKELRPRYAIAENVKALTSTKFKNEFATVLSSLEEAGYNNYWRVLNAKDYGIPQNRERVFIVSIRRDVDEGDFQFPDKEPLMLRLRDMLEPAESVDEKYYLSTEREGVQRLIAELEARYSLPAVARIGGGNLEPKITIDGTIGPHETDRITSKDGMVQTLKATDYKNPPKIVIDGLTRDTQKQKARVFNPSGLAASLIATDYKEPPQISVIGQLKGGEKGRVVDRNGIGYTLTATEYKDPLKIAEPGHTYGVRIRKLTPRECWRLMGFLDEEFNRVHGISNSQLYKQAGNSIVVNVLSALLSQLFYKELV